MECLHGESKERVGKANVAFQMSDLKVELLVECE